MMPLILISLIAIVAIIAYLLSIEGIWTAASTLLCVVISGLIAMNFFEPFANFLQRTVSSSEGWAPRWDMVALLTLFAIFVTLLRVMGEALMPKFVDVHPIAHEVGRWGSGVLAGYVTAAILLTSLHTTPLPREFMGFQPERPNLLGIAAPDRQWLGFTQYLSEKTMPTGRIFDGPTFEVTRGSGVKVWPSFPIRYATRREQIAQGTLVIEAPPTASSSPAPAAQGPSDGSRPAGGGGGGGASRPAF